MVWIHGGGFVYGSGSTAFYGPEYFMTSDVVLVTINYRLGLLGFLALDDQTLGVSGNAGMKDQVMALRWVQENIQTFGGDPKNVTIFGESAGSASVHALILSPMAKGLFHRAIMQSGCVLNAWAIGSSASKELQKYFNVKNDEELLALMRQLPVEKLIEAQDALHDVSTILISSLLFSYRFIF